MLDAAENGGAGGHSRVHDGTRSGDDVKHGDLRLNRHDQARRILRAKETTRVRVKSKHAAHPAITPRRKHSGLNHRFMTEMDAIKDTNRQMQVTLQPGEGIEIIDG
jgi:hypothetical protein